MATNHNIFKMTILSLLIACRICSAAQMADYIPENLKPWEGWVLHGKSRYMECIPHFNDSEAVQCTFPTAVVLDLNSKGGEFMQKWRIFHQTYIPLPGNGLNWPKDVVIKSMDMVNNVPAVVVSQSDFEDNAGNYMTNTSGSNTVPSIKLEPGDYTVTGKFVWQRQPEYIQIPPQSALVTLRMDGIKVDFPNLDDAGRLWLKNSTSTVEKKEENRLKVESFRLVDDGIPPQIILYATLDVAGVAREVKLGPLYSSKDFIPISLETSLPAKLESDGTIRIQLKPGRHRLNLILRHLGQLDELAFEPPDDGYWPGQEIWSVVRRPDLRVVEISGVTAVDPKMTSLPEGWKSYPTYMMAGKERIKFKEIKRGDPVPPPDQLTLNRTLWLSFDGTGYTVQDTITGRKSSGWRLEIEPLMQPGKVTIDGVEQLITKNDSLSKEEQAKKGETPKTDTVKSLSSTLAGVELRRGSLNLVADSKIEGSVYTVPATGWIHPFQKVTGTLNLPPGWKLIAAKGVDNISGTWIRQWSLLDIFILLIFTIATAKRFSLPLAVVGFITMVLLYHEPGAPRYIWLLLLLGFVMLDLTRKNQGRLRKAVNYYQFFIVIFLVMVSVPYAIDSLRIGIYPQLENRWISVNDGMLSQTTQQVTGGHEEVVGAMPQTLNEALSPAPTDGYNMADKYKDEAKKQLMDMPRKAKSPLAYLKSGQQAMESRTDSHTYEQRDNQPTKVMQYDPESMTQTGPGLPLWQPFRTINFSWSGPVEPGQTVSFTLIGPFLNLVISFLRVALIILLTFGMFRGAGYIKGKLNMAGGSDSVTGAVSSNVSSVVALILTFICIFTILPPSVTNAGEFPSPEILAELQKRLLEQDRCFPSCADISDMDISIKAAQVETLQQIENPEQPQKSDQPDRYKVYHKSELLQLTLHVDAAVDTIIPLPGHVHHWLPEEVLINGTDADAIVRQGQNFWAMVSKGKNTIVVRGRIGNQNVLQLPLPMRPHSGKIVNAIGWEIQGIQPDGTPDDQLQLKRIIKPKPTAAKSGEAAEGSQSEQEPEILETGLLPPFALVERTLLLGLDWKVETTVQRLTPTGSAIVLNLPLLEGESVITEGLRVKNGMAEVTLNALQSSLTFESFLEISDRIRLYHALSSDNIESENGQNGKNKIKNDHGQNRDWTERWRLDASPVFHVESEGIPVILHQNSERWYPTWHPWPGEEVILKISRPKGIGGQTMTVEQSTLELYPGQRTTRSILNLSIKSSQGSQHTITIPKKAELQEVKINGAVQLIRQEGQKVVLPITPGIQKIQLVWKDESGITPFYRTPAINLGAPSVNAAVDLHISSDRWTLFVGGEQLMSPAVLFWSKIIVVLLVSLGLAMTDLAPLKFYQWSLLGIGMSMSNVVGCLFVAAWLVVLDMRKKWGDGGIYENNLTPFRFNMMQLGIAGLTFIAILCLLFAISQGLVGHPSMNITGNGSSGNFLRWYQDVSDSTLPVAWSFSLPMFAYRIAMLAWALWLSFWLLAILKWGWGNFAVPVIWIGSTKSDTKSTSSENSEDISQEDNSTTDSAKTKKRGWTGIKNLFGAGKG